MSTSTVSRQAPPRSPYRSSCLCAAVCRRQRHLLLVPRRPNLHLHLLGPRHVVDDGDGQGGDARPNGRRAIRRRHRGTPPSAAGMISAPPLSAFSLLLSSPLTFHHLLWTSSRLLWTSSRLLSPPLASSHLLSPPPTSSRLLSPPLTSSHRLQAIPGVIDVHDLHVWSLVGNKINIWAHLTVARGASHTQVRRSNSARSVHTRGPCCTDEPAR